LAHLPLPHTCVSATSQVLLNFIKDIVHATRLEKQDGTASKQMRWHESSKRMLAALKKFGGPRSFRLIRLNFAAPSDRTAGRCWNRDLFRYPIGLPIEVPVGKTVSPADEVFAHLAELLKPKMALLQLKEGEKLPCQFSQDETPITSELTLSQHRDSVLGSCGWQGAEHVCCDHFHVVLGDDAETAGTIEQLSCTLFYVYSSRPEGGGGDGGVVAMVAAMAAVVRAVAMAAAAREAAGRRCVAMVVLTVAEVRAVVRAVEKMAMVAAMAAVHTRRALTTCTHC
jgi:hypothetical protein